MPDVGGLKPGTILGEEAKPPFAVLPDPSVMFLNRSKRFAVLAPGHELCATMWNVARVKCVLCDSTDATTFSSIEGQPDTVKAETCEKCREYVKILYQVKDPALEPIADDVASLVLDLLLAEKGWKRGGHNPFLLGY